VMENKARCVMDTREIYYRYRCPNRPSEHVFVMMRIGEELCAITHPRSNDGRKQIGMFLAAHARGLSSTLSRASIINQRILASGRRIHCDAHVDRTHETEINAVPGDYEHFASALIQRSPLT